MPLDCRVCDWKGTPKESGMSNTDSHACLHVSCPNCAKMVLVVEYPLAKDHGKNDIPDDDLKEWETEMTFIPNYKPEHPDKN